MVEQKIDNPSLPDDTQPQEPEDSFLPSSQLLKAVVTFNDLHKSILEFY